MRPSDIADLVAVSDPRVSPDGATVAYVVTTVDMEANEYPSRIWTVAAAGGDPRPLTSGDARELKPRWSPDGGFIAYVDHPEEKGSRLRLQHVGSGDTTDLLAWPEEIEDLVWTPDARRLVFTARERDEAVYAPDKDKHRPPRRINRLSYRLDSVGWTVDRPRHVLTIAVDGSDEGAATALTSGPYQDAGVSVSPDAMWLCFSSARTETWDTDLSSHLYRIPLDASAAPAQPEQLTDGSTTHGNPSWSPDGRHIAFVWGDRHSMMRHGQVGVVDLETGDERLLTTGLDLHCAPYLAMARDPLWDGDSLLFQVDEAGNVPVYRARLDGTTERVIAGDRQVTGFDAAEGTLAFVAAGATTLPELFVLDRDGGERQLTRVGEPFTTAHPAVAPERFSARSPDGAEVEAWLIKPAGFAAGQRYPVLLNIHGGPFSQYGNRFFDEFQVQSGSGYAVLYCNPRGSSGYSSAFSRGIRGPKAKEDPGTGWGGADYDDITAVVDEALARFPFLDAERLGVLGGSYGGYMTSWIIGHTNRFKAACSERSCNNLFTFAHTSDIGASFPAGYIGASHLEDPDEFLRQSPVTYWRDMQTPLLIMHSENDLRCPIEQAEDLWLRLKLSGRDVEFVRFPGESHELSRNGAPRHRVERHQIILEWFGRKL